MENQIMEELKATIKYDLFHYPQTGKKEQLKYLIKRLLRPGHTPKKDPFFWPQALFTQALEAVGEWEYLVSYYDSWKKSGMNIYHPDNVMNGYSLVYVYEKTGNVKYKEMMDRIYRYVCSYYGEYGQTFPYRRNHPTHVYVDGLGMVVPFLCRYGAVFGIPEAVALGQGLLLEFLEKGMDETTGLPYHGYDLKTGVKYGIIGWGRAAGWLLLAMADSVEYMKTGKEKERIVTAFQKLAKDCFAYLQTTGYFCWQLSAVEGPVDTSATAMIGYAIAKGKNKAFLRCDCEMDEMMGKTITKDRLSIKEALDRVERALALSFREGRVYDCSGECEGYARYPQSYGAYPWSNGPCLRFLWEKNK